jgi:NitT/TauT family transport system substrate-binding protein
MKNFTKLLTVVICLNIWESPAQAEVSSVTIAHQTGWSHTPFYVMERQKLVEKHAKELGIDLKATYPNMGTPGIIRDAMIAGQIQFGALGPPTLVELADKTFGEGGTGAYKAVASIISIPMFLNTRENVTSVCDLKGKGKIALPTVKIAVQAVTLDMATDKFCKDPTLLDSQEVGMTHPDGMQALLTGQIGSHFTAPPFQNVEVAKGEGKIKTLLTSYDILGGKASFILLVGSDKFRMENPKAYQAVLLAFTEALAWINADKRRAAAFYLTQEKPRDTLEDIVKQMSDPSVLFDVTPQRIGEYAAFMHKIGTAKHLMDWKALSMPNLHDKQGS